MNNSSTENPNNQSPKKKSVITRWIIGAFFAMFALINGFHYSSLFLLCAAFLMFPLTFVTTFLQKRNIKTAFVIILSVLLFFIGTVTAPPSERSNSNLNNTTQSSVEESKEKDSNTTKPDSSSNSTTKPDSSSSNHTTKPDSSLSNDEKIQMVWVASSGTNYHSRSTCSNMNSPRQISLDDAKQQGYTACKKCH